jgi:hypothetical protein
MRRVGAADRANVDGKLLFRAGGVLTGVPTLYNRIQGRNLERLAALSDGIFAVAMTLLVLDLHIPTAAQVHGERELAAALCALGPQWLTYGMSFLTLGIFWAGQQTQLNHIGEGTRDLTWIHLGFLFSITLMPLSTRLLAEFITYRLALGLYWLNIFVPGARGGSREHLPTHSNCAVALRGGGGALLYQYLGEHCGDCAGAAELCDCATVEPEVGV